MGFIPLIVVPKNRKVVYTNIACDLRPFKIDVNLICVDYWRRCSQLLGDASSPAISLLDAELLLNIVILDCHLGKRCMSLVIKPYFLQSFLDSPEYLRIHSKCFLDGIKQNYNIASLIASDEYIFCKIKRDLYN